MNSTNSDAADPDTSTAHSHASSQSGSTRSVTQHGTDAFVQDFPQQTYDEWTMRFTALT